MTKIFSQYLSLCVSSNTLQIKQLTCVFICSTTDLSDHKVAVVEAAACVSVAMAKADLVDGADVGHGPEMLLDCGVVRYSRR